MENSKENPKKETFRKIILKQILFDYSLWEKAHKTQNISYVLLNNHLISKNLKALGGFIFKNEDCIVLNSLSFHKVKVIGNISIFEYTGADCNI